MNVKMYGGRGSIIAMIIVQPGCTTMLALIAIVKDKAQSIETTT